VSNYAADPQGSAAFFRLIIYGRILKWASEPSKELPPNSNPSYGKSPEGACPFGTKSSDAKIAHAFSSEIWAEFVS
jgi:hypothetical protein